MEKVSPVTKLLHDAAASSEPLGEDKLRRLVHWADVISDSTLLVHLAARKDLPPDLVQVLGEDRTPAVRVAWLTRTCDDLDTWATVLRSERRRTVKRAVAKALAEKTRYARGALATAIRERFEMLITDASAFAVVNVIVTYRPRLPEDLRVAAVRSLHKVPDAGSYEDRTELWKVIKQSPELRAAFCSEPIHKAMRGYIPELATWATLPHDKVSEYWDIWNGFLDEIAEEDGSHWVARRLEDAVLILAHLDKPAALFEALVERHGEESLAAKPYDELLENARTAIRHLDALRSNDATAITAAVKWWLALHSPFHDSPLQELPVLQRALTNPATDGDQLSTLIEQSKRMYLPANSRARISPTAAAKLAADNHSAEHLRLCEDLDAAVKALLDLHDTRPMLTSLYVELVESDILGNISPELRTKVVGALYVGQQPYSPAASSEVAALLLDELDSDDRIRLAEEFSRSFTGSISDVLAAVAVAT